MKELRVILEMVTPMFLGGADARGAPELRPPAFRGALRYWLRSAIGGLAGDDPGAVGKIESTVFGSADENGSGSSTVNVRIRANNLKPPQPYNQNAMGQARKITKNGREVYQASGRNYLYWSLAAFGDMPSKQYHPEGSTFSLILAPRYGAKDVAVAQDRAVAALWLMLQLGGIGSRSRRTAGSLSIHENVSINDLNFQLHGQTEEEIADELGSGLKKIPALMHISDKGHWHNPPLFDILSSDKKMCRIWVLGVWDDVMGSSGAVETVGYQLGYFRTYRSPDHEEVAKWLNGSSITTVERAAFGLPIPYRYSHGGPKGTVQGRTSDPSIERRASPLWLKISKTATGKYVAIATLFKSSFFPDGEGLHAKGAPGIEAPGSYQLIEDWISTSFKKPMEVI